MISLVLGVSDVVPLQTRLSPAAGTVGKASYWSASFKRNNRLVTEAQRHDKLTTSPAHWPLQLLPLQEAVEEHAVLVLVEGLLAQEPVQLSGAGHTAEVSATHSRTDTHQALDLLLAGVKDVWIEVHVPLAGFFKLQQEGDAHAGLRRWDTVFRSDLKAAQQKVFWRRFRPSVLGICWRCSCPTPSSPHPAACRTSPDGETDKLITGRTSTPKGTITQIQPYLCGTFASEEHLKVLYIINYCWI